MRQVMTTNAIAKKQDSQEIPKRGTKLNLLRWTCADISFSCSHPRGLTPVIASIDRIRAQLLLNAHQLVVLCIAIGTARSSSLDLTAAEAHGDVCNGDVLCLT